MQNFYLYWSIFTFLYGYFYLSKRFEYFLHLYTGYQRQLNYKHHDGAYSTFGSGTGNTWWEHKHCKQHELFTACRTLSCYDLCLPLDLQFTSKTRKGNLVVFRRKYSLFCFHVGADNSFVVFKCSFTWEICIKDIKWCHFTRYRNHVKVD